MITCITVSTEEYWLVPDGQIYFDYVVRAMHSISR